MPFGGIFNFIRLWVQARLPVSRKQTIIMNVINLLNQLQLINELPKDVQDSLLQKLAAKANYVFNKDFGVLDYTIEELACNCDQVQTLRQFFDFIGERELGHYLYRAAIGLSHRETGGSKASPEEFIQECLDSQREVIEQRLWWRQQVLQDVDLKDYQELTGAKLLATLDPKLEWSDEQASILYSRLMYVYTAAPRAKLTNPVDSLILAVVQFGNTRLFQQWKAGRAEFHEATEILSSLGWSELKANTHYYRVVSLMSYHRMMGYKGDM